MSTSLSAIAGLALAVVSIMGMPAAVEAQVVCGDTIGPNAKVTLTADIATCMSATSPALTIVGPATVDMAGHRVVCNAADRPVVGIQLEGKGVKLMTGSVLNCGTDDGHGVEVSGEGKHKVENLVVEGSLSHGVRVHSDQNSFKRVVAKDNNEGWEIDGLKHKLEDVVAIGNVGTGFEFDGDGGQMKRITAVDNGTDGLSLEGDGNKTKDGVVIDSAEDGVDIDGVGNKVDKTVSIRNGVTSTESGFDISDSDNQVKKSRVYANGVEGIRVGTSAQRNVIKGNVALGNTPDLADESPGGTCDGNAWSKNVFGTSLADGTPAAACIQ